MESKSNSFDAYFFSPVSAVRPWLVEKCVLVLLALDMWFLRLGAANRYDADELNVAHFGWLDSLGPVPGAGLYIGVAVLVGVLALAVAIAGLGSGWKLALVVLYTYTWAMSRLDTYQHHYLLSWVLLCIAFFPRVSLADFWRRSGQTGTSLTAQSPLTSAWAWVLLSVLAAVVYCYTAVAKLDGIWQSGACLRQLAGTAWLLQPGEDVFVWLGGSPASFWSWMAKATVVVELLIAVGYLLMPLADRPAARWTPRPCFLCWLLAIALHGGFELAGLRIGWFSYFMMLLATASFLPASWLEQLLRPFVWLVPAEFGTYHTATGWRTGVALLATFLASAALLATGWWSDLPGVWVATALAVLVFVAAMAAFIRRQDRITLRRLPVSVLVAALVLAAAFQVGNARSKYYPYRLAQVQRRGQFALAAELLPRAERYVNRNDTFGQNNLAWFLATTPEDSLRDGEKAIRYALRSCKLTKHQNASALDTLACAYAANGDYERALETIGEAEVLLKKYGHTSDPLYADIIAHKALFMRREPYLEQTRYRYHVPPLGTANSRRE